jgi:hypothetical protein
MVMLMVMVMVMVMVAGMKKPESGRNRTPARFRQIEPELLGAFRTLIHFKLQPVMWRARSRWAAIHFKLRLIEWLAGSWNLVL